MARRRYTNNVGVTAKVTGKENLEEFKQAVVKVALEAADYHEWCDVIRGLLKNNLGLADYLPPIYVVEKKYDSKSAWSNYESDMTLEDSIEYARDQALDCGPAGNLYERIDPVRVTTDIDQFLADVKSTHEKLLKKAKRASTYPQFRVRKDGTDEVLYHINARGEVLVDTREKEEAAT